MKEKEDVREIAFRIANSEFWSVSNRDWNMDFQKVLEERVRHWEKVLHNKVR